jgi:hypothetical protein
MKIKKWSHFLESLQTPLTENDKEEIGKALIKSCISVWGYINQYFVSNHGLKIRGEILRLSKNNRILINYVNSISPSNSIGDLVIWIKQNEKELYHPDGLYFNDVIKILTNSYNRGKTLEDKAKDVLIEYFDSIGVVIAPFSPNRARDEQGYDIFWKTISGGVNSAQVKTLDSFSTGKFRDFLRCRGHLKPLVTNLFIAINDNECYIYRTYKHQVTTEYLSFPKSNLVYHKTF